jgi:16S rRNA (guanine527-N7)-methyltransferase
MLSILSQGAAELGLDLTPQQLDLFERYAGLLLTSGRQAGVTSIDRPEEIERRHLLESLAVAAALLRDGLLDRLAETAVLDLGSGGGLPGLPIKVLLPHIKLTLLDAGARKAAFLHQAVAAIHLDGVEIVTARAEDAGRQPAYREQFDLVLARAVAPLPVLLELALPFLRVGGHLAAPKGSRALAELAAGRRALETLGGAVVSAEPLQAPGSKYHQRLLLIEKTGPTPAHYPRKAGIPQKRPLTTK